MTGNAGVDLEQRLNPSIARADNTVTGIMQNLRCHLVARVETVNYGPPLTVSVIPTTNEFVLQNASGLTFTGPGKIPSRVGPITSIDLQTKSQQLPILTDVPVSFFSMGGWNLTFPINPGDECLILFADTPLDVWFQCGGVNNEPISQRRHSLSDGIALFGLRSTPNGLQSYSQNGAELRNNAGTTVIRLANDGTITITGQTVNVTAGTVNVNTSTSAVNINSSSGAGGGKPIYLNGIDFLSHVHTGVAPGGGNSGPVEI